MPSIKVAITVACYLITLFLMPPLTAVFGMQAGPVQVIVTESLMLLAVLILNRLYIKQRIRLLPTNTMSELRKNGGAFRANDNRSAYFLSKSSESIFNFTTAFIDCRDN